MTRRPRPRTTHHLRAFSTSIQPISRTTSHQPSTTSSTSSATSTSVRSFNLPRDSHVRPIRQALDAQRHITSTTWAKLQGSIFTAAQPHELCVRSRSRFHSRASTVIAHGETSFAGQPPTTAMHEDTNLTSTPPETKPGSAQRSKLGRSFDIMNQLFNSAHGHMLTFLILLPKTWPWFSL